MTPVLLDTHLLLWAAEGSAALPEPVRLLLDDPAQTILFSAVSIWEVAIKRRLEQATFTVEPDLLHTGLLQSGYTELRINSRHATGVRRLELIHKDPFDRLLVAQAMVDRLTLITSDEKVAQYSSDIRFHPREG
ncbi:type II toxin-antitoxin system VapC family toxin [Sphingomonas sp. VNH70]|uniref:type II toxin-antitoxin system VapC family toxin n=1 Tax=Sphingomonas silueang TaxID=3156617 RepID=UPI0032B4AFAA